MSMIACSAEPGEEAIVCICLVIVLAVLSPRPLGRLEVHDALVHVTDMVVVLVVG